jgi:hypothetical protein
LKENYLHNEISNYTTKSNYQLIRAYHFGGYAKIDQNLISFMNAFYLKHQIPLDPIYTGKMVYGIDQMLEPWLKKMGVYSVDELTRDANYVPIGKRLPIVLPVSGYACDIERFISL